MTRTQVMMVERVKWSIVSSHDSQPCDSGRKALPPPGLTEEGDFAALGQQICPSSASVSCCYYCINKGVSRFVAENSSSGVDGAFEFMP